MRFHNVSIFVDKDNPITPKFRSTFNNPRDIHLVLHSGTNSCQVPEITIFFGSQQETINFKNAVIQSWETFLRNTKEEKSNG